MTLRQIIMDMRSALARFLLRRRGDAKADHRVPLQDGGWFRENTGELVAGFAIEAEDIVVDVGCGRGGSSPPAIGRRPITCGSSSGMRSKISRDRRG